MQDSETIDLKCINTIRTLSMDAVQAANSGHPGRADGHGARGLLPVATIPALRPAGPDLAQPRPFRPVGRARVDAPVLAAPPDRGEGRQQGLRDVGRAVGAAGGDQALPAAWQPLPRPPGVPLDQRRRNHHRPARAGAGQQRRHGHRRAVVGRPVSPAGLRGPDRLQRLRPVRRRLHHGGNLGGGGFVGRPPEAF